MCEGNVYRDGQCAPYIDHQSRSLAQVLLCERPVSQWQIKWLHLCLEACTCGTALFPLWRLWNYHKVLKVTANQLTNDHLQDLLKIINIIIENWLWWAWTSHEHPQSSHWLVSNYNNTNFLLKNVFRFNTIRLTKITKMYKNSQMFILNYLCV